MLELARRKAAEFEAAFEGGGGGGSGGSGDGRGGGIGDAARDLGARVLALLEVWVWALRDDEVLMTWRLSALRSRRRRRRAVRRAVASRVWPT